MKRLSILSSSVLASLLLMGGSVDAQRLYVRAASTGGDGSSWQKALSSLQSALSKSKSGSEVWVASGVYAGGFRIPAGVSVVGGFQGHEGRKTQRDLSSRNSVLDGGGKQRVAELLAGSALDGFRIQNGRAGGAGGGGVLISAVSATIENCFFTLNVNTAGRGAALHVTTKGHVKLSNSIFYKNKGSGHVIDFTSSSGLVQHIIVYDNVSNGLHFHAGSSPHIYSSVFMKNSGRGLCHISSNDKPIVENNLIYGNSVSLFHYRGTELRSIQAVNGLSYAKGNITGDPLFADPLKGDFRLGSKSPALDRGVAFDAKRSPSMGYYGNARIHDAKLDGSLQPDIGAAEQNDLRLSISGTAMPGGKIKMTSSGPKGLPSVLLLAPNSQSLFVPGLGQLFVELRGLVLIPQVLPSAIDFTIPRSLKLGSASSWQFLAISGKAIRLSQLAELELR